MFRDVPRCSGMFQNVPGCSIFRVLSTPSLCHQTPTEAGARDYSEGLVPQYFDVSFYIVKLLLYNLIQTVVFDKCNIQFLPCTLPLQFLMYKKYNKKYISVSLR